MDSYKRFELWLNDPYFDEAIQNELFEIKDNMSEIDERFYRDLEFGTAGLRGIVGAGTNRMNKYTVRKASQGLASYLLKNISDATSKGIVIAYDSRHFSKEFALETAMIFAWNGIKAYLFDELRPVPELSFAVRHLKTCGGIMVTASHNTKEYNGYKVYSSDGAQLATEASDSVLEEINNIKDIRVLKVMEKQEAINKGLLQIIGKEVDDIYISKIKELSLNNQCIRENGDPLKIVYTPLHGTGNKLVRRIFEEIGIKDVIVVKEQELPDPNFSTVSSPNPGEKSAFKLAIELARKENADLIIGTDPDCDRVGVVTRKPDGEYVALTGDQIGCLLMEYILSQKKAQKSLSENGFVVKTIVTTDLTRLIAENYGVELIEVLTGFKFIGEKIRELDENGDKKYLFGFEESYGYLAGTFSRDKDGVVAAMLIAEMSACYKIKDMSLYQGLQDLYQKYEYALEGSESFTLEGKDGLEKIEGVMEDLRLKEPKNFGLCKVKAVRDYLNGVRIEIKSGKREKVELPESNVLYYEMADKSWFCIRPSGTEPKIKIYFGVLDEVEKKACEKLSVLKENVMPKINKLVN